MLELLIEGSTRPIAPSGRALYYSIGELDQVCHFSDGISEELLNGLARIGNLRVAAIVDALRIQLTFAVPPCRSVCITPKVFIQPKHFSIALRIDIWSDFKAWKYYRLATLPAVTKIT